MNTTKACLIASMMFCGGFSYAYAEDVATLPTIKVMADAELRNEVLTTVQPFQEDDKVRRSLQHQIIKQEQDIQNNVFNSNPSALNVQPQTALPDLSQLSPLQQQYVLAVASGLQSSDPSSGLFRMLEPLGINRERALEGIRNGAPLEIRFDEQRMSQLFGDQWRNNLNGN